MLDAWGWCAGKAQGDGMGRGEGGGFRMGSMCVSEIKKKKKKKKIQIAGLLSQRLQVSRSESGAGTKFAFLRVPR